MLRQSQCECDSGGMTRYRHTLTVQSPNGTNTAVHLDYTDDDNWTGTDTIKANFISKSGREFINAERVQADQSQTIETPSNGFSRSIQPSWRLKFGTRTFQILSVVDVNEERQKVRIEVKEHK